MSLYLTGGYNLLNQYCDVKILGRIPTSIASVMGNIGQFSTSKIVDKMSNEAKNIIESITVSPFEKMMSTIIPESDLINIPPLYNAQTSVNTREFIVFIEGVVNNTNSIKYFKWHSKN